MPEQKKYMSPQQEMEALSASLSAFFEKVAKSQPDPATLAEKKQEAARLQQLIKQNGYGPQSTH